MKRLTNQICDEMNSIGKRIGEIVNLGMTMLIEPRKNNRRIEIPECITPIMEELNTFKVRLENILCETDVKEQVHKRYGYGNFRFSSEELLRMNKCTCFACNFTFKT